jgi:hypothetical protein
MSVRFQVLTAASTKIRAFWDIASCNLVRVDRRFRYTYCLHHQGDLFITLMIGQYRHRSNPTRLHGAISQKALIFKIEVHSNWD